MNANFITRYRIPAIVFAFFFPFVLTWCYLLLGANLNPDLQKGIYGTGKVIQFLFPVVWIFLLGSRTGAKKQDQTTGESPKTDPGIAALPVKTGRYLIEGSVFGMAILVLILFAYFNLDFLSGSFDRLKEELTPRLARLGLARPVPYIILGIFYCVIHSGLEEYYWRWFVFGQLNKISNFTTAMILASIGFTLHHILLLGAYFGYTSLVCWICALGVFTGGLYWVWIYRRSKKLYASWLSHAFIDLALFIVGYLIIMR